ncbi:MAG TPA: MBL fold metallo-hydrolase [Gemmatimonadaceae bacterium]|nr:MBL fold metallo-hydrolase [Gemmatimonadaceae bacterium]
MRLWSLGSGSKGNALLVECGDTRVLVDAGFPARTLSGRLTAIGVAPASISACVMTHEHIDHVRGATGAAKRWGWALHATAGTAGGYAELADAPVQHFEAGATLSIGRAEIATVATSHDATDPIGLVVTDRASGARAAIVYDLGAVTAEVRQAVRDVDVLVIEANHDEGMLRSGPYPRYLQNRIASRTGHLSNRASAALCADVAHSGLNHIVLAHLSETNNDHGLATQTVSRALGRTRFNGRVSTAAQHAPVGPFCAKHSRASARVEQLALAL